MIRISPRRWPLRARLTVLALVVEALILAALGAFLYVRLRQDLVDAVDSGLAARAAQLTGGGGTLSGFTDAADLGVPGLGQPAGVAQLIDRAGRVQQSSGDATEGPLLGPAALQRARGVALRETRSLPGVGATRLLAAPAGRGRVLIVGSSLRGVQRTTDELLLLLIAGGGAALLLSGAGAWWLTARALRPIDRLSAAAAAIEADELDTRVPVPETGDEVARLARVLNGLLARVERAVEEQRSFVADASHELRSPVAVLQAELDVALRAPATSAPSREVLESLREETGRLTQLTDNLLVLARADAGRLQVTRAGADLVEVARRALRLLGPQAERAGLRVITALQPAPVWGDADRLSQVAINLLDNAVRHARGARTVRLETGVEGDTAWLAVTDDGAGVPAALVPALFDRFTSGDAARTRGEGEGGAGLGLAIARAVAAAHAGRVELERTGPEGSRFVLRVPARATDGAPDGGAAG